MQQIKKYHFYAAHRNETLDDKCKNIHGHTYYVEVELFFKTPTNGEITMLFSDVDKKIDPIIQDFDHGMLINVFDPLYPYLKAAQQDSKINELKLIEFDCPTSVESLAKALFQAVKKTGLPISKISIQETTSSTINYYGD